MWQPSDLQLCLLKQFVKLIWAPARRTHLNFCDAKLVQYFQESFFESNQDRCYFVASRVSDQECTLECLICDFCYFGQEFKNFLQIKQQGLPIRYCHFSKMFHLNFYLSPEHLIHFPIYRCFTIFDQIWSNLFVSILNFHPIV